MKKQIIILSTLGTVLIIVGLVLNFGVGLKQDKKEVNERMNKINTTYEQFRKDTETFSNTRDYIYDNVFSELYFETLNQNITICLQELQKYEETLDVIEPIASNLKKNCANLYFPDSTINTKCQTYANSYEEMVNYFVNDVIQVNNNIEEYNKYQQTNQTGIAPLQKYNTTKKYIDFNEDKKYAGKEDF